MTKRLSSSIVLIFTAFILLSGVSPTYELAVMKYRGGGDWYGNPSSLTNLISFCNSNLDMDLSPEYQIVESGSPDLLNYPFVHLTGHGNIEWNEAELNNIRTWLKAGGFLHVDDNYGMDPYIRPQLEALFPEHPLTEISASHPIFKAPYLLEDGLPKIHEHDGGSPQAYGIFIEGRLAVFYTFEADLGDGWEDPEIHNDPESVRLKALQMGANLITYAFNGSVYVQNE